MDLGCGKYVAKKLRKVFEGKVIGTGVWQMCCEKVKKVFEGKVVGIGVWQMFCGKFLKGRSLELGCGKCVLFSCSKVSMWISHVNLYFVCACACVFVCVCVCVLLAGGLLTAVLLGLCSCLHLIFLGDIFDSLGQLGPCASGPKEVAAPYMQT